MGLILELLDLEWILLLLLQAWPKFGIDILRNFKKSLPKELSVLQQKCLLDSCITQSQLNIVDFCICIIVSIEICELAYTEFFSNLSIVLMYLFYSFFFKFIIQMNYQLMVKSKHIKFGNVESKYILSFELMLLNVSFDGFLFCFKWLKFSVKIQVGFYKKFISLRIVLIIKCDSVSFLS